MVTAALTLADVRTRVYRIFGDEANVQLTDEDITRWVNDAQRHIVMNNELLLKTTATANTVAGTDTYSLPSDLHQLITVHYKRSTGDPSYYKLKGLTLQQFDETIDGWDGTLFGSSWSQVYFKDDADSIILFPRPDASEIGRAHV